VEKTSKKMGPMVKRLVCEYAAVLAVPPGGGIADAMRVMTNPQLLQENLRAAGRWVEEKLAEVKRAPDNTFGEDDEAIAKHILDKITERKAQQQKERARV